MNKIKKPKLISFKDLFGFVITALSPLLGIGHFKWQHFLFIYLLIIAAIIAYMLFKYLKSVSIFYHEYESQFKEFMDINKNRNALIEQFQEKQLELKRLNEIINQYDLVFNNVGNIIQQGICNISKEEKQYLSNLYNILCQDKEYLYKIKGGK